MVNVIQSTTLLIRPITESIVDRVASIFPPTASFNLNIPASDIRTVAGSHASGQTLFWFANVYIL